MKRSLRFIFFLFLLSGSLLSQKDLNNPPNDGRKPKEKEKSDWDWRNKFYFGGNFGGWFGTQSYLDISPIVGYKITKKFSVGVGTIYNYYSTTYITNSGTYKFRTSFYGGRCFARYFVTENVFAQVGYDHINRNDPYGNTGKERMWVDNYLVGGGVRYPIGDRLYCTAVGLWNLNYSAYSPYPNPILQIGFVGRF